MNKEFFILGDAIKEIGGDYPQHQKMGNDETYDYSAPDSVHQLKPSQFLICEPNFTSIILSKEIKLTDKISSAPIPWYVMIVNEKLLNILKCFTLPPYRVYSVPVLHNNRDVAGYYAIHILLLEEFLHHVLFEQSKFWITKLIEKEKVEELSLSSLEDFKEASSRIQDNMWLRIRAEFFSLRREFLEEMDLFALPGGAFPVRFYISSELRMVIEDAGCTGIRFIQRQEWEEGYHSFPRWSCVLNLP